MIICTDGCADLCRSVHFLGLIKGMKSLYSARTNGRKVNV
jgi:hypothetical protein